MDRRPPRIVYILLHLIAEKANTARAIICKTPTALIAASGSGIPARLLANRMITVASNTPRLMFLYKSIFFFIHASPILSADIQFFHNADRQPDGNHKHENQDPHRAKQRPQHPEELREEFYQHHNPQHRDNQGPHHD